MFNGIYTPIITPFSADEKVDYGKMEHNLAKWGETDLDGIVVLGSNGEFVYLSEEEKMSVVEFAIKHFNKDKKVIVGVSNRLEIWDKGKWESYNNSDDLSSDEIASQLELLNV